MVRNQYILLAFRLVVGGVFIWAGLLKIFDPLGFAQSIKNYRVFSPWISFFLALVLPWVEVFCGIGLISGLFRRASALVASLLLASFLGLIMVTVARGIDVDCGCFGGFSQKVDYRLLIEDSLLFFLSLNVFLSKSDRLTLSLKSERTVSS